MNNILKKSILLPWALFISLNIFAVLTDEQQALLDQLPPDQRESVMTKMETANKLEKNLEEVFEEQSNLITRPEYADLENLRREDSVQCMDCIFGYDFFQYAPTTFAPVDNVPVTKDYGRS